MTGTDPFSSAPEWTWSSRNLRTCARENGLREYSDLDDVRNQVISLLYRLGLGSVTALQGMSDDLLYAMCPHQGAEIYKLDLPNTCYPADGFHYLTTQYSGSGSLFSDVQSGATRNLGTLISQNHLYVLVMQDDCNLVRYEYLDNNPHGVIGSDSWQDGNPGCRLVLQDDGNLVVYRLDTGGYLWAANQHGLPDEHLRGPLPYSLRLTNDGDIKIYNGDGEDTEGNGKSGRGGEDRGVA